MTSRSSISKAVQPGSMAYGDRAGFDATLAAGQPAGGRSAGGPIAAPSMDPGMNDPIGMLLSGALGEDPDVLTAGLSVGPGPGPTQGQMVPDSIADRLRIVAQHAKTPLLRAAARNALRRRVLDNGGR